MRFPSQYLMASSLMRFQEHYESPNRRFRSKFFTVEDYMDWSAIRTGDFSYFRDWAGFNFPYACTMPFVHDFTRKEHRICSIVEGKVQQSATCYIIASVAGDNATLAHEIVHALFYFDFEYQARVRSLFRSHRSQLSYLRRHLLSDYHRSQVLDETNAYLTTGLGTYADLMHEEGLPIPEFQKLLCDYWGLRTVKQLTSGSWQRRHLHQIDLKKGDLL